MATPKQKTWIETFSSANELQEFVDDLIAQKYYIDKVTPYGSSGITFLIVGIPIED